MCLRGKSLSFFSAAQGFEEKVLEQALAEAGGGVTGAAKPPGVEAGVAFQAFKAVKTFHAGGPADFTTPGSRRRAFAPTPAARRG